MIRALLILIFLTVPAFAEPIIKDAFSPHQGATSLVVKTIGAAHKSIRMAAYYLTSHSIAAALIDAKSRGVLVFVVLDKSQRTTPHSLAQWLRENNISVRINDNYRIMHNKFIIVDDSTLETGSFNYTSSAENANAENVLVVRNAPAVITDYLAQWNKLWAEAN